MATLCTESPSGTTCHCSVHTSCRLTSLYGTANTSTLQLTAAWTLSLAATTSQITSGSVRSFLSLSPCVARCLLCCHHQNCMLDSTRHPHLQSSVSRLDCLGQACVPPQITLTHICSYQKPLLFVLSLCGIAGNEAHQWYTLLSFVLRSNPMTVR